jgi:uncharacterized membrane protein YozB (DUF420 family)
MDSCINIFSLPLITTGHYLVILYIHSSLSIRNLRILYSAVPRDPLDMKNKHNRVGNPLSAIPLNSLYTVNIFWTFSVVWYSGEHDVSETGSVSVLR